MVESVLQKYEEKPLEWRVIKIGNELIEYCNAKLVKKFYGKLLLNNKLYSLLLRFVDDDEQSKRDIEIQTSLCDDVNKSLGVGKSRDTKHVEALSSKKAEFILNIRSPMLLKNNEPNQVIQNRNYDLFGQPLEDDYMKNFMTNNQTATTSHDFFSFNNLCIEPKTTSGLDFDELTTIRLKYTKLEDLY